MTEQAPVEPNNQTENNPVVSNEQPAPVRYIEIDVPGGFETHDTQTGELIDVHVDGE